MMKMLNQYLDRGTMYALDDGGVKAECVVTDEGDGIIEIKNLAVLPEAQCKGYGRALIRFVEQTYAGKYHTLQVATGDSPITVPYYASNGFTEYCRNKDYITEHYDHPIYENGVLLRDQVVFRKKLQQ